MEETQEMQVCPLGWEDSPGEGNGNPLQYSCLENPMDRGAQWAAVQGGRKESDTTEPLSTGCTPICYKVVPMASMKHSSFTSLSLSKNAHRYHPTVSLTFLIITLILPMKSSEGKDSQVLV